jgi:DNA-binding MarR family transcriptional regulator
MYMHDMASHQDVIESYIVESCACHKVRMAARAVTRAYDDALRPLGLRATQLAVLVAIAVEGAMSITALAKFMIMDRSTLTRNLRPLEEEGLVAVGLEGWRRSRTLEVTEKGRSRLAEALPLWKHAQETLRRKLGEQNWANLHSDLDQLIRSA